MIEPRHLEAARAVVAQTLVPTPLREAQVLGPGVWIKLETEQPTGSFKVRGALARLAAMDDATRAAGVIAASAGNHGMGLAWASRALGVRCAVYVPSGVPRVKREGIAELGAAVVIGESDGFDETEDEARDAAAQMGATYVSPYDDPDVAAGNGGTLGLEILDALPACATIVAPVGGGGLIVGLGAARRARGAEARLRLVGVQSEASPAMALSLERGMAYERYRGAPTLAEGLEGGVSARIFAEARRVIDRVELVREDEIAAAMAFARDELGVTVEGSAAVAVAWIRRRPEIALPAVVILTGRNLDADQP